MTKRRQSMAFFHNLNRDAVVSVLLRSADDPQPLIAEGEWHGEILPAERGEGGFGYDPIFVPEGQTRTTAQMLPAEKDAISHRGRAFRRLALTLADRFAVTGRC